MFWEFSPDRASNPEPPVPPATAPMGDFELLDKATDGGPIDVARVSDWLVAKLSYLCKLAKVHVPHFVLLHLVGIRMSIDRHKLRFAALCQKWHADVPVHVVPLSNASHTCVAKSHSFSVALK